MRLYELNTGELIFEIKDLGEAREALAEQYVNLSVDEEREAGLPLSSDEYKNIREAHLRRLEKQDGN
jgi:hypothetical protein